MEIILFPPMSELTAHHLGASPVWVEIDSFELFPMRTVSGNQLVGFRWSSKILLVVGVDTMNAVVLLDEGAHDSFVLPHKKVLVKRRFMQQRNSEFGFVMHKGAILSIGTLLGIVEMLTISCFESLVMVHLLHDIVSVHAAVRLAAKLAFFRWKGRSTSSVVFTVVKRTLFWVVRGSRIRTRLCFVDFQEIRIFTHAFLLNEPYVILKVFVFFVYFIVRSRNVV